MGLDMMGASANGSSLYTSAGSCRHSVKAQGGQVSQAGRESVKHGMQINIKPGR
jgi:hypothetical protein